MGGGEAATAGPAAGAAFIGRPQFGQATASVETSWPQSSHLTSAMPTHTASDRRRASLGQSLRIRRSSRSPDNFPLGAAEWAACRSLNPSTTGYRTRP
jgi:hypothetical protein